MSEAFRRTFAALAALLLAAGVLSACGGSSAESDSNAGVLKYGYEYPISRFDPHRATASQDNVFLWPVYDRLVHISPEGEPIPGLAESWEFSDDGKTMTLHLREGVKFHDGEVFDAEAVKANLERGKSLPDSAVAGDLATIETITVVDPQTVQLNLSTPNLSLPLLLTERGGAMISPKAFENPDLDTAPVGTGMFEVVDNVPGEHVFYEPSQDYWDADAVKLDRLEIYIMQDATTRTNALRGGQLDWAQVQESDYESFDNDDAFETELFDTLGYYYLLPSLKNEALQDVKVRQALNHAIDRESMFKALYSGIGTPCGQEFPPGYFAHSEEHGCNPYPFDPDQARKLLDEAGYGDGLKLEALYVAGSPKDQAGAEVLQRAFADVGVTLKITGVDAAQYGTKFQGGESDFAYAPWGGRPSPLQTLFLQHHSSGPLNPAHKPKGDFDRVYAAASSAATEDEQNALVQELVDMSIDQAFSIPLGFRKLPNVYTPNVEGVQNYVTRQEFRSVSVD